MKVFQEEFEVTSSKRIEIIDITEKIAKIVKKSEIENGICQIFLPHATAAIILEENENGLIHDIENYIKNNFPRNFDYEHNKVDDNADSHLVSGFIGQSRIYPVKNYEIVRGTWQRALFLELDGPRRRKVFITIIGE
jgi:secondary thiamine-phosphate synthase enzyme